MQSYLIILVISILALACGRDEQRYSTHEEGDAAQGEQITSVSAFHSELGWETVAGFFVHEHVPEPVAQAAIAAATSWNEAVGRPVLVYQGRVTGVRGESLYASLDDDVTVVYYEDNWQKLTGKSPVVLATTVWENDIQNSGKIIKGDVILNSEAYLFQDSTLPASESVEDVIVDSETVLLHEFGHLLGLSHVDDDENSVMLKYTRIGQGAFKREPSSKDIENISKIYSHH